MKFFILNNYQFSFYCCNCTKIKYFLFWFTFSVIINRIKNATSEEHPPVRLIDSCAYHLEVSEKATIRKYNWTAETICHVVVIWYGEYIRFAYGAAASPAALGRIFVYYVRRIHLNNLLLICSSPSKTEQCVGNDAFFAFTQKHQLAHCGCCVKRHGIVFKFNVSLFAMATHGGMDSPKRT